MSCKIVPLTHSLPINVFTFSLKHIFSNNIKLSFHLPRFLSSIPPFFHLQFSHFSGQHPTISVGDAPPNSRCVLINFTFLFLWYIRFILNINYIWYICTMIYVWKLIPFQSDIYIIIQLLKIIRLNITMWTLLCQNFQV